MPSITKQRQLRTGDLEFSATTASDVDQYLIQVDDHVTKVQLAELFVAEPGNPIPKTTIKQLGSGYMICDNIRCFQPPKNASYVWYVHVTWKEMEQDVPQPRDVPTPSGNSTNPNDWALIWSKRSQVVYRKATEAFYVDGYPAGVAKDYLIDFDPGKAPLVNSALQPFARTPEERRLIEIWSFQWLRTSVSNSLLDAENKINTGDFILKLPGLSPRTWKKETALIDTIDLSNRRWGNLSLVEINAEIIVDPEGWEWKILDQGTAARRMSGDPDGKGGTVSGSGTAGVPQARQLLDEDDNPVQDPVAFGGDGQPKAPDAAPTYGNWLQFEKVNFATLPLIKELD